MNANPTFRILSWLLASALTAWSGHALAQQAPGNTGGIDVLGVDLTTQAEIPVPVSVIEKARYVYGIHAAQFRSVPHIDTRFNGVINGFYVKRAEHSATAAAAGNYYPFGFQKNGFTAAQRQVCSGTTAYGPASARENWCLEDKYSFRLYADAITDWNSDLLISHEFIHLRQYDLQPGLREKGSPYWLNDGQANGIGFGLLEREKGFSRRAIALRTKGMSNANFSFFLGLRRYDVPLDIESFPNSYPIDHPEYYREVNDPKGYRDMGGYMTGSFWRYVMRGRPQGLLAYRQMMKRPGPSDPGDSHAWLRWTDEGLKAATYGSRGATVPIWRGGLRQVFSEMITELADFPDIVAKNRGGKLAAPYFDSLLWTRSCRKVDLTTATSASLELKISPYSAQCLRVKMPLDPAVGGTTSPTPTPFSVAAWGPRGCEDLELGTRGQLLTQPHVFKGKDRCALVWSAGFAPLRPNDANGLRGWQTVLLINAPSDPDRKGNTFKVHVVRPVAVSTLSGSHTVHRNDPARKRKAPLPQLSRTPEGQLVTPVIFEPEDDSACEPQDAAIFACGDIQALAIQSGDAAQFARAAEVIAGGVTMHYPQGSPGNYGIKTLGELYQEGNPVEAIGNAYTAKFLAGTVNGATITLAMRRLAEGEIGTFPTTMEVIAYGEGRTEGDDPLTSLGPKQLRSTPDGCVEVLSYQTNGTVQITVNSAGILVGSASATLYEENSDDATRCSKPLVPVGTVQVAFSTAGVFAVGPRGNYELDFARAAAHSLNEQDRIAQMQGPMSEWSNLPAEDEMDPTQRGRVAAATAGGVQGAGAAAAASCGNTPITPEDRSAFLRALANATDSEGPGDLALMERAMQAISNAMLAVHICDWIAAGRPAKYEMGDVP